MPISVLCGGCSAKLNAPDAAAGKRVKCPKCATLLQIPAPEPEPSFEVVADEPAPPPKAKGKPKPVLLDDDEPLPPRKPAKKPAVVLDDEDDEDEKPRPKRKTKAQKAAGVNKPLVLGAAVGVLALAGVLFWYFVLREPQITSTTPPPPPEDSSKSKPPRPQPVGQVKPPPAGWHTHTGDGFACSLPLGTTLTARKAANPGAAEPPPVWVGFGRNITYQVQRNPVAAQHRDNIDRNGEAGLHALATQYFAGHTVGAATAVTVDGVPGVQFTIALPTDTALVRLAVDDDGAWLLTCFSRDHLTDADPRVKPFFESFAIGRQFQASGAPPKVDRKPSAPKPATKGWRNYSTDHFEAWLPDDAEMPKVEKDIGSKGSTGSSFKYGFWSVSVAVLPFEPHDMADFRADPTAHLTKGAAKFKEQMTRPGFTAESKAATIDGRPSQEVRLKKNGRDHAITHITSTGDKAFIVSIAGGPIEDRVIEELVTPFFDNFIPK